MQSRSPEKTKSAPNTSYSFKKWWAWICVILLCAGVMWFAWAGTKDIQQPHAGLGNRVVQLEVARTPAAQNKGLSNRESLAYNQGMLFTYDATGYRCFWMKDMQFSIDIIWITSAQTITHIDTDVSPGTYPKKYCAHSQYVLEVPAGTASASGATTGQKIRLTNIE